MPSLLALLAVRAAVLAMKPNGLLLRNVLGAGGIFPTPSGKGNSDPVDNPVHSDTAEPPIGLICTVLSQSSKPVA